MSASVWIPGLIVLGVGSLLGIFIAWRLRPAPAPASGPKKKAHKAQDDAAAARLHDMHLQVKDLERRRGELYAALRGETEDGELDGHDRLETELAAARVLRDLERIRTELGEAEPRVQRAGSAADKAVHDPIDQGRSSAALGAPVAPQGFLARHPLLVGFSFGAGMVTLVAVLIFWAIQDAKPDPMGGGASQAMGGGAPGGGGMPAEHPPIDTGGLSADVAAHITDLERRVNTNPNDLGGRKELALLLLSHEQFLPAFQQAEAILGLRPEDPDGLYVEGVVRLTMGQAEEAIDRMDRVLAQFPDHVLALMVRGVSLMRIGDKDGAIATWERGLEAAGGSHPDIEFFIDQARSGGFEQLADAARERSEERESAAEQSAAPADATNLYVVEIELDPSAAVPASGGVLFLSLRPPGGGPPVAVQRVVQPRLPLTLTLGAENLMMGDGTLPTSGKLSARLDADGSVTTTNDGPSAEADGVQVGGVTRLVLR